jgi:uncharacterized protein Gcw-chp
MAEDLAYRASRVADPDAIARAHAVYTPLALAFYDVVVHGLSNRFAWRCPTKRLLELYAANLSANHLEAGPGTGLFLDRAGIDFDRLVLLDINEHCLARAARRLVRFKPALRQAAGNFDYFELSTGASYTFGEALTPGVQNYWSPNYSGEIGDNDALEFSAEYAFSGKLHNFFSPSVSGGVGWQWFSDIDSDFTYWNAGLTLGFMENWSADVRYWDTDFNTDGCAAFTGFRSTCDARVVGTLSASF